MKGDEVTFVLLGVTQTCPRNGETAVCMISQGVVDADKNWADSWVPVNRDRMHSSVVSDANGSLGVILISFSPHTARNVDRTSSRCRYVKT